MDETKQIKCEKYDKNHIQMTKVIFAAGGGRMIGPKWENMRQKQRTAVSWVHLYVNEI